MNLERQLVIKKNHQSDGKVYQNNFKNRYLEDDQLRKPSLEQTQALAKYTQQELGNLTMERTENSQRSFAEKQKNKFEASYIKYVGKNRTGDQNSGAQGRIIKMQQTQVDPLAPPQFRHKRIAPPQRSPPAQVLHSPPKKLTVQDQLDWKIPPCISNWKNPYGYTIPLDMRLSADGRNLQHSTINDKFSQFTNAMYLAEKQARQEIEERIKIQKSQRYKEYLKQEEEMREAAIRARKEKDSILEKESGYQQMKSEEGLDRQDREDIRQLRKRELEREARMGKLKNRDISEKVVLGQAQADKIGGDMIYDQQLFYQNQGLGHGLVHDDDYNLYDKPLFQDKAQMIRRVEQEQEQEQEQEDGRRKREIEFQKGGQEDIFRMDEFVEDGVSKKVKH